MSVYYAAIGSGVLALLVVVVFFIYLYNRRQPSSHQGSSYTTSHFPNSNGTPKTTASTGVEGSGFLGYPPSPPHRRVRSVEDEVSPSTSPPGGRLQKINSGNRNPYLLPNPLSPRRKVVPVQEEEESEMVMVTYEEGLKKLGLNKIQHILYPDPPTFNETGDINLTSVTPPFSSLSSRPTATPNTADLLTPGKTGAVQGFRQDHSPLNHDRIHKYAYSPSPTRSPPTPRAHLGRDEGRFPTDSELMTTGIPSYYHDSSAGRYKLESPDWSP